MGVLAKLALALVIFCTAATTDAEEIVKWAKAAIRAPVACPHSSIESRAMSCGNDTTAPEAQAHRDRMGSEVPRLDLRLTESAKCDVGGAYVWAHPEDYAKGPSAMADLIASAESGAVRIARSGRYEVVEALPTIEGQQRLAVCSVSSQSGPPRDCVTVAVLTKNESLLRGEVRHSNDLGCSFASYYRLSGSIDINFEVLATKERAVTFATALNDLLIKRQSLSPELTTEENSDGYVGFVRLKSSAALRDSSILTGWREAYDFDATISKPRPSQDTVSISATLRPMVSRLAVGSLTEYQGLDDAQRAMYSAFFDGLVGDAIKAVCKDWKQLDGAKIACK